MGGYLDRIKEIEQFKQSSPMPREAPIGHPDDGLKQPTVYCEISELCEERSALLDRLRTGSRWLADQHQRWQAGDTNAADDAEFSRVWNGWWELDNQLRAGHGFQGCIHAPGGSCPEEFGCHGCTDTPAPAVAAQLALLGVTEHGT